MCHAHDTFFPACCCQETTLERDPALPLAAAGNHGIAPLARGLLIPETSPSLPCGKLGRD
jgi:hypothetical protein